MNVLDAATLPLHGTHLIEASAGTGKTHTIATLVERLVVEAGLPIDRILVITFTRAATAELRDRVRRRLVGALAERSAAAGGEGGDAPADVERLAAAVRDFDTAPIFTIHGFCQRVLQEFAFESGTSFEATLDDDDRALRAEIVADYWARATHDAPEVLVAHLLGPAKVTPSALDALARTLAGARGAAIVPAPDADAGGEPPDGAATADLDAALATWRAAVDGARAAWAAGRAAVEAELVHSPALRHGSFSKSNVPTWLGKLEAWLAAPDGPVPGAVGDVVDRFAAARIEEAVKPGHSAPAHPLLDRLEDLAAADAALRAHLDATARDIRRGLAGYLARETRLRRERAQAKAFDDLLHDLADALDGDHGPVLAARARARYAAALVDEFQDTDDVQYRVVRALFGPSARDADGAAPFLALIGDPKQAIYAFRGADIRTYLRAAADAGPGGRWTLGTNWRSDDGLVAALNAVWSEGRVARPFLDPGIACPAVIARRGVRLTAATGHDLPPLAILRLGPDDDGAELDGPWLKADWAKRAIPRRIATEIARLLAAPPLVRRDDPSEGDGDGGDAGLRDERAAPARPLEPGDIAVLTRTNDQAGAIAAALARLGIPHVVHGDASVFETDEADELARVLAAVLEPGDGRRVRGALATRLLGADAAALTALAADEAAWEATVERFRGWLARWQSAGFVQAYRRLVDDEGVAGRLLRLPDGERRLTNLQHLAELLHGAAHADDLGPRALVAWLARMRTDRAAREGAVGDSAQLRLERDSRAVQVVTIHRSKGLEYAVVYCPYLWHAPRLRTDDGLRFHDPATGRPSLDVDRPPAPAHCALAAEDMAAEELRLAYVALTRAKHHCAVVWGPVKGADGAALARLLHPLAPDAADAGPAAARTHAAARLADPAAVDADLAALAAACAGHAAARPLADGAAPRLRPPRDGAALTAARRFAGAIAPGRRRTSYSALTADRAGRPADSEAVRDHDAEADAADAAYGLAGEVEAAAGAARGAIERADAVGPAATVPLDAFPAGADPGTCLHAVFERIDFQAPDGWPAVVVDACRRAGLTEPAARLLGDALPGIVATPLRDGPDGFALADIGRSVRLNEMPFVLPLAAGDAAAPLAPAALAGALATDGDDGLPAGYADAVGRLGFAAVRGHLSGYVDMVARVGERWYIFDWKSNRLGATFDDYTPARIAAAMAHHHYHLQYLLYCVAVRRYLTRRVPGFRHADHFGGVCYLFVRGLDPRHGPRRGVFFARPSSACLDRLDAVLDGRADR